MNRISQIGILLLIVGVLLPSVGVSLPSLAIANVTSINDLNSSRTQWESRYLAGNLEYSAYMEIYNAYIACYYDLSNQSKFNSYNTVLAKYGFTQLNPYQTSQPTPTPTTYPTQPPPTTQPTQPSTSNPAFPTLPPFEPESFEWGKYFNIATVTGIALVLVGMVMQRRKKAP